MALTLTLYDEWKQKYIDDRKNTNTLFKDQCNIEQKVADTLSGVRPVRVSGFAQSMFAGSKKQSDTPQPVKDNRPKRV